VQQCSATAYSGLRLLVASRHTGLCSRAKSATAALHRHYVRTFIDAPKNKKIHGVFYTNSPASLIFYIKKHIKKPFIANKLAHSPKFQAENLRQMTVFVIFNIYK
jgi:hypothetical protein